ncbi:MAG: hypothetical protein DPW14_15300 [Planctomycetes bacterium]|nr:hypothetical protein [Planctomycetota bacterium]
MECVASLFHLQDLKGLVAAVMALAVTALLSDFAHFLDVQTLRKHLAETVEAARIESKARYFTWRDHSGSFPIELAVFLVLVALLALLSGVRLRVALRKFLAWFLGKVPWPVRSWLKRSFESIWVWLCRAFELLTAHARAIQMLRRTFHAASASRVEVATGAEIHHFQATA